MNEKTYYSKRNELKPKKPRLELVDLVHLFRELYLHFSDEGYFQEFLGFRCKDYYGEDKYNPGKLGTERMVAAHLALRLQKNNLWPIEEAFVEYADEDVFDLMEYLYEHVSKPVRMSYSHGDDCAHYREFNRVDGRQEFRARVNEIIGYYGNGYELNENGEILALPRHGLEDLLLSKLSEIHPENIRQRIDIAIIKFRRRKGVLDDKRDAVRSLIDILEFLRPELRKVISKKDEDDLFNIANNFGLRHHNDVQKTEYDEDVWYEWMFYYYLATINAILKKLQNETRTNS